MHSRADDLRKRNRSRSPIRSPSDNVDGKQDGGGPKRFVCFGYRDTGSCRFGDDCSFSHDVVPQKKDACRDFTYKGACAYGNRCRFAHEGGKAPADSAHGATPSSPKQDNDPRDSCRDFLNKGRCRYGPQCKFKHIDANGRVVPPSSMPPAPQGEICRDFFNLGRCKYGAACKYLHSAPQPPPAPVAASWPPQTQSYYNPIQVTRDSSQICAEFTAYGMCRTGDSCPLVHLASCARPPGSVIATSVAPAFPAAAVPQAVPGMMAPAATAAYPRYATAAHTAAPMTTAVYQPQQPAIAAALQSPTPAALYQPQPQQQPQQHVQYAVASAAAMQPQQQQHAAATYYQPRY